MMNDNGWFCPGFSIASCFMEKLEGMTAWPGKQIMIQSGEARRYHSYSSHWVPQSIPIIRWWRWWIISIDENLWSPKISINWRCVYHLRLSRPAIPCYPAQRSPQRARTRCGANRASPPAGASWTSTGWTPKRWLRCRGDHGGDGDDWTGRKKLMKWLYNLPIYGKWWEKWWNMVKNEWNMDDKWWTIRGGFFGM